MALAIKPKEKQTVRALTVCWGYCQWVWRLIGLDATRRPVASRLVSSCEATDLTSVTAVVGRKGQTSVASFQIAEMKRDETSAWSWRCKITFIRVNQTLVDDLSDGLRSATCSAQSYLMPTWCLPVHTEWTDVSIGRHLPLRCHSFSHSASDSSGIVQPPRTSSLIRQVCSQITCLLSLPVRAHCLTNIRSGTANFRSHSEVRNDVRIASISLSHSFSHRFHHSTTKWDRVRTRMNYSIWYSIYT